MVSLSVLVIASVTAGAEPDSINKLLQNESLLGAHKALYSLERQIAAQAPLEVSDGQLLRAPAAGLGIYTPAPKNQIIQDEIFLYAHIRNHVSEKVLGGYRIHLVSDLLVLDSQGNELAQDRGFGTSEFTAKTEHRDTFVNIALKATGLPPGPYVFRLIIHDKIGNKRGQVDIPVVRSQ